MAVQTGFLIRGILTILFFVISLFFLLQFKEKKKYLYAGLASLFITLMIGFFVLLELLSSY